MTVPDLLRRVSASVRKAYSPQAKGWSLAIDKPRCSAALADRVIFAQGWGHGGTIHITEWVRENETFAVAARTRLVELR